MNALNSGQQKLSGGSISGFTNNTILRGIGSAITNIDYDNIVNNKLVFKGPEFIIEKTVINLDDITYSNVYFNSNLFYYKTDIDNKFQNILIPNLGINIIDNNISVNFAEGGWSSNYNSDNSLYTLTDKLGIGISNPLSTLHINNINAKLTISNDNVNDYKNFNFYYNENNFILGNYDIHQFTIHRDVEEYSLSIDEYSTVNIKKNIVVNGQTNLTSTFYINNKPIVDWLVKDNKIATEEYVNNKNYLSNETILYGKGSNITNLDYKQITLNKLIFNSPLVYDYDNNTVDTDLSFFGWTSNSDIIYSSFKSRIGIGTSNPFATLHIGTTVFNNTDENNYNNDGTLIISKIESNYNINKNFKFGYDDNYNFSFGDISLFADGTTKWTKQFYINSLAPEGSLIINNIGNINIQNSLNINSNLNINNGSIILNNNNNQVKFNIDNNNNLSIDNNIIINNKKNTIGIGTNPDDNFNLLINGDVKFLSDFYAKNINASNINLNNINVSNINVSNINTRLLTSSNINNINLIRTQQLNATFIISSNNISTSNINVSNIICTNNIICSNNLNVVRTLTVNTINATSNVIINNILTSRFINATSNLTVSSNITTNILTVLSNINANNIFSKNIETNNINTINQITANIINSSFINNLNNIATKDIFSSNITTSNINSLNINTNNINVLDNIIANNINTSYIINNNKIISADLEVISSIKCNSTITSRAFNTDNIYISDKIGINTSTPISELHICRITSTYDNNTSLIITGKTNNYKIGYNNVDVFCLGSYNTITRTWKKQIVLNNDAPDNSIIIKNSGNISFGVENENTNDIYKLNVVGNINAINIYENGVKILNNTDVNELINTTLKSYLTLENATTFYSTKYYVETTINTNIDYIEDLITSLLSINSNIYTNERRYPYGTIYDQNKNETFGANTTLKYFENNNIYGLKEYFVEKIINRDNSITLYNYEIYYSSGIFNSSYVLNKYLTFSYSDIYTTFSSISWGIGNYKGYYNNTPANIEILNKNKIITSSYYGDFIIIKYEFNFILTKFRFYAINNVNNNKLPNAPSLWRCYGSNDAAIWTEINDASNDIDIKALTFKSYIDTNEGYAYYEKKINNDISYKYIGFVFRKIIYYGYNTNIALELFKIEFFGRKISKALYISSNVLETVLTNYTKNDYISSNMQTKLDFASPLELSGNTLSISPNFLGSSASSSSSTEGLSNLIVEYISSKTDTWKKISNTSKIYYIGDTIGIGTSDPNPFLDANLKLNISGSIITSNINNYGNLNNVGNITANGNIAAIKYFGDGSSLININYNNISTISKPNIDNLNNWNLNINTSTNTSNCYYNLNGNIGIGYAIRENLSSKLSVKGNIYSTGIINAINNLQENNVNLSDKYLNINGGKITGFIGIGTDISSEYRVNINGILNASSLYINNNPINIENFITSNYLNTFIKIYATLTDVNKILIANYSKTGEDPNYLKLTNGVIDTDTTFTKNVLTSNLISSNIINLNQITTSNLISFNINTLNQITTSNLISSNINALNQITTSNLISSNINALNQITTSNLISSNIINLNRISTSNLISSNIINLNRISTSNLNSSNIINLNDLSTSNLISSNIINLNDLLTSNLISSNIINLNDLSTLNLISSNINAFNQITTSNLISSNINNLNDLLTSNLISSNINNLNDLLTSNLISSNINNLNLITTSNLISSNINNLNRISTSNLVSSNIINLNLITTPNLVSSNIINLNDLLTSNLNSSNIINLNQITTSNLNTSNINALNQITTSNLNSSNIINLNLITTSNLNTSNIINLNQITTSNLNSSNINNLNRISTSNLISSNIINLNQISTSNLNSSNIINLNQISTSNLVSSNINSLNQISTPNLVSSNINALNQISTPNLVSSNINALNQISTSNLNANNINALNQISTSILNSSNIINLNRITTANLNTTFLNALNQISTSILNTSTIINLNDISTTTLNTSNINVFNQMSTTALNTSNLNVLNQISTSNLISSNINALNQISTSNVNASNINALNQISTSNLISSNINALNQISTANVNASNINALNQISTSNLISVNNYANNLISYNINNNNIISSYSIYATNNIGISDNPSSIYKLNVNGIIYSSTDIISDGNIKEQGIYLKDKYLLISNYTASTINTETLKDEILNNQPNVQKKYGFRCICSKPIILNNQTYYKHDVNLSLYTKNKVDSIDENPYRIFGIRCFSTSAIFNNNIPNKPPNVLQYDIYTSHILNTNSINICAIGFPSNYYLNKITASDIFILKTNNYNYISILSKIPNLSVSCIISDFLF